MPRLRVNKRAEHRITARSRNGPLQEGSEMTKPVREHGLRLIYEE
nr:MAG TPA: hypothetical protein [Caudoviricetes sp.]